MKKAETPTVTATNDPRWKAMVARDRGADDTFFFAVKTTGVYCRPSCGARTPRPEHVEFYRTASEAEQAGFRPCKRCKPDQMQPVEPHAALVAELCRLIENAEGPLSLKDLAKHAGLSTSHLHRLFRTATGVTPWAYGAAHRVARVKSELTGTGTITDAIYGAGYGSNGRFYEQTSQVLGMTPTEYRSGGTNREIRFAIGACSLGAILVAATGRGVCAISLGDDPEELIRDLHNRFSRATLVGGDAAFEHLVATVAGFVESPSTGLSLPLDIRGTAFQHRVWQALQDIQVGETASYAKIADRIGSPKSARAVARACAANPVAVAIPCHRVVRNNGALSGYRWGIERKRKLLDREARRED